MKAAVVLGAVIAGLALLPSSAASGQQKRFVLTALAGIGTVYWRFDCVHYRAPEWSLGVRLFNTATTTATYRAGHLRRHRTLQPGTPTVWFPFRRELVQRLSLVQATEPGTLHGHVLATFERSDCESYFPPRLNVQLYPG